jgi:hypothetical protein
MLAGAASVGVSDVAKPATRIGMPRLLSNATSYERGSYF